MAEKLIRQNIPLPPDVTTRKADPSELDGLLGAKVVEEAKELAEVLATPLGALDSPEYKERKARLIDEAADILEALNTILHRHGITSSAVAMRIEQKHDQRGGFVNRVLVYAEGA